MRTLRKLTLRHTSAATLLVAAGLSLTASGCNVSNGWGRNQVGMRQYQSGNFTAARRSFEQAMMNDPWNPDYAFNVAAAMQKQGDSLAAERMYQHALTLNPGHQPSYHSLAGLLEEQGRSEEAQELLTAWVDTQPYTPESHIEMAHMQQERGDYAAAEASLQEALHRNPRHPRAMAQLGQVYERTGRPTDAAAMYRRSLGYNRMQPQVAARMRHMNAYSGSPSMMMAQQMQQYDPTLAQFPYSAPSATSPFMASQTAFMPTPMGPPVGPHFGQSGPWMNGPTAHTYSTMSPVMTAKPWQPVPAGGAMATTMTASPQPMVQAVVPAAATTNQMAVYPIQQTGGVKNAQFTAPNPMQGTMTPAGGTVVPSPNQAPAYLPQPVQFGTPAPISQNPSAAVPAISAAVPVVQPF